jgi:hypothetical protein
VPVIVARWPKQLAASADGTIAIPATTTATAKRNLVDPVAFRHLHLSISIPPDLSSAFRCTRIVGLPEGIVQAP